MRECISIRDILIEKVFKEWITKAEPNSFSKMKLYICLLYLYAVNAITYTTYSDMVTKLCLFHKWDALKSKNGILSFVSENENPWGVEKTLHRLPVSELIIWIIKRLYVDENMSKKIHNMPYCMIMDYLNQFRIPNTFELAAIYMFGYIHVVFSDKYIFFLEKEEGKEDWNLYRRAYSNTWDKFADESYTLVDTGVEKMFYRISDNCLYYQNAGQDSYVEYEIDKEERNTISNADLLFVSEDHKEWFFNGSNKLCYRKDKKVTCLCYDEYKYLFGIYGDLYLYPLKYVSDAGRPIQMKGDDEDLVDVTNYEASRYLWEQIVLELTTVSDLIYCSRSIQDRIAYEKAITPPVPFSIMNIQKKWNELFEKGLVDKDNNSFFINMMNSMQKKDNINKDNKIGSVNTINTVITDKLYIVWNNTMEYRNNIQE